MWGSELKAKAEVCYHLSTLLRGGVGMVRALEATRERVRSKKWRTVLDRAIQRMRREGCPMAEAFEGGALQPLNAGELAAVHAGEASGQTEVVLLRLSERAEEQAERQQRVAGALVYPVLLLVLAALSAGVPSFAAGQAGVAWLVVAGNLAVVGSLLGLLAVLWNARCTELGEKIWLHVPGLGRSLRLLMLEDFLFLLRLLLEGGVHWADAVHAALAGSGSVRWAYQADEFAGRIREGHPLAEALEDILGETPEIRALLATGEESGRLVESLRFIGEQLALRNRARLENASAWLPRIAYLCAVVVVAWQVVQLYGGIVRGYEELLPAP